MNYTAQNVKDNQTYNKVGFLSSVLVDLNDELENTNQYARQLKFHLKGVQSELSKITKIHYDKYHSFGMINDENNNIHSLDIFAITIKAYCEFFEMLKNDNPNVICSKMEYLKNLDKENFNWQEVNIPAEKILI